VCVLISRNAARGLHKSAAITAVCRPISMHPPAAVAVPHDSKLGACATRLLELPSQYLHQMHSLPCPQHPALELFHTACCAATGRSHHHLTLVSFRHDLLCTGVATTHSRG
jgi:hypothetical protein